MVVPLLDEAAAGTSPARSELMVANSVKEDGGVRRYHHQSVRRRSRLVHNQHQENDLRKKKVIFIISKYFVKAKFR